MWLFQVTASVPSPPHFAAINIIWQNRFMTRDDVLVWLSFVWFVALCGAAIWVLFPL
jgi:hypothetical protein